MEIQKPTFDNISNKTTGYNHWTLLVEDKGTFCQHLKEQGVEVIQVVKPHGYTFFIEDPERNLIEVKSYALGKF